MEKQPARSGEPTQLGSYKIVRKLARGGMAELYLARAPIGSTPTPVEKLVVVKRILPKYSESAKFVQLFLDEARLAASLNHAHIVQVYDIGQVDSGGHFFTMEFLHGQDLRSILHRAWREGQRVPIHHAIQVAGHVGSALHYAHEKRRFDGTLLDIVHRDVSPSNVIVSYDGAVKLVDFGVAKAATSTVKTRTGTLKGKIAYMSPEQARGAPLDRRSDVFSLGIVLWEMVTTQRLFRAENDLATLQLIINQAPKRPSEVVPDCPAELERIILKALSLDPTTRYQTAEELQLDLEALVKELGVTQSAASLATYLQGLFGAEVASWEKAQAAGVALGDHLTNMIGNDFTTPVSESDFVGLEDIESIDDGDEFDDDDERTELAAELKPIGGMIDAVTPESTDGVVGRPATSDGVPATAAAKPGTGPTKPPPVERSDALRTMEVAESVGRPVLGASPTPPARRDPTGPGAKGTPAPQKVDPAMYIDAPDRRRDPTGAGAPQRTVSPLAFIVPRGNESADRPSSPSVSPVSAISRLAADTDPGLRIPPPAERSDALRTMIPAESVGRPVLGSSPTAPAAPHPEDAYASGSMQIQRGTGAVASLPAGEPVQRPSTPALSPWPAAQGSSPQTPATPFPAAHNLMRDVPLLQDIAADRAHAHAQDHAFPPLQQVHRKALLIGAALLVVGLIVAIATSGGSNKTAAKAEGDDAPPPVTNPDPPREAPVKQPVAAPPTQVPDAAPQKVDEPPPSPAPPEDVSPGEVVMDPEPTATPGSGSAPRRRPAVVPKQAPKRQ